MGHTTLNSCLITGPCNYHEASQIILLGMFYKHLRHLHLLPLCFGISSYFDTRSHLQWKKPKPLWISGGLSLADRMRWWAVWRDPEMTRSLSWCSHPVKLIWFYNSHRAHGGHSINTCYFESRETSFVFHLLCCITMDHCQFVFSFNALSL